MPILILLLILILLIAQIRFWDTFIVVLGGIAILILFALLLAATVVLAVSLVYLRLRGGRL
jgi:hypothetical protein